MRWKHFMHAKPLVMLSQIVILILMFSVENCITLFAETGFQVSGGIGVNSGGSHKPMTPNGSPMDTSISIRHGRSRGVRDQYAWHERHTHFSINNNNNNNNNYNKKYNNNNNNNNSKNLTKLGSYDANGESFPETVGGTPMKMPLVMSSSINSGNGNLFGSDYWLNSDLNGTLANQEAVSPGMNYRSSHNNNNNINNKRPLTEAPSSSPIPTPALVTHRIRKLHKKKIMESIRQRADKSLGLRLSKNHRSLIQAEHLQGRPTDSSNDNDDDDDNADVDDDDNDNDNGANKAQRIANIDENNNSNSSDGDGDVRFGDGEDNDDDDVARKEQAGELVYRNKNEREMEKENESEQNVNSFMDNSAIEEDGYLNDEGDPSSSDRDVTTTIVATTETNERWHESDLEDVPFTPSPETDSTSEVSSVKLLGTLFPPTNKQTFQPQQIPFDRHPTVTSNFMSRNQPLSNHEHPIEEHGGISNAKREQQQQQQQKQQDRENLGIKKIADKLFIEEDSKNANISFASATFPAFQLTYDDDSHENENKYENENDYALVSAQHSIRSNYTSSIEDESIMPSSIPSTETTALGFDFELNSFEPSQLASTSVGGISLDRQSSVEIEEINFEDKSEGDDGITDERATDLSVGRNGLIPGVNDDDNDDDSFETSRLLVGVVDAANEDEIYDWDEISRNNRRNLMRGRDVVTKFLQIVETQHMLGSNCEAGTSLNLGEGVVDRYAQERFRVEAEVAVNRANMLTRIFKMTSFAVQADVNLLHASVLSMVEFDDDIFAAGNCFDWNEHPSQPGLFCPFAYRLPAPNLGAIFAKDLATEYHYLGNTSEWFFQARKNAEKVIVRNEQYLKAFHLYSNKTEERIEDDTLAVKYEDGRWSKPYYDCGGGNIWMLTYTVPFFGYENNTYHFKGTSGIDIDLRRVDIDQCPQRNTPGMTQPLNIFAGTDKCKQRTTMCEALKGLGFRRGSYKCICRKGYFFPDIISMQKYFNGSLLEEEYEKLMLGKNSTYNVANEYECLPCAEGCDSCEDGSPCIAALNWPMRTSILVLACTVIGLLPPAAWFTFRYQQVKVVRAASPALLRVIALGAFFIYCTNIVMYPNPNLLTCTARIWMREIGFSLTYGALMLKTWRISVIFRVRSAKAVKITDAALLKRLGCICGVIGTFLLVRTLVSPPGVVVGRTADDLKAFLCKTDWWDYTFTSMEVLFLAWGVRLCIMVRKAPSEFNESRFISMAIYNEFLLTCFLNVSMLFLQSPANPDLLYIIFFCHTQLTVTLLLGLIFGSKVYIVLRSGKSHQETIGMGAKASGAKFNFRPQVRTFANPSSVTTSTAQVLGTNSAENKLTDQEALEEIRQLSVQLQRIQEMAPPKGVAVMTISSLLDGLKAPGGGMMIASVTASQSGNQLQLRQQQQPLLALNSEIEKYSYNQQLKLPQNNNVGMNVLPTPVVAIKKDEQEKAVNTDISGKDLCKQILDAAQVNVICNRCLEASKVIATIAATTTKTSPKQFPLTACQELGSPHAEGSLSFANIKLECMCSQPDDLDLIQRQQPQQQQQQEPQQLQQTKRRKTVRSAATNTPPASTQVHRKHSKSKMDTSCEATIVCHHQICDNCKEKYSSGNSSKYKKDKHKKRTTHGNRLKQTRLEKMQQQQKYATSDGGALSQTQSADILERGLSTLGVASVIKKIHSIDDITFYTSSCSSSTSSKCSTTDDEGNGDGRDDDGNEQHSHSHSHVASDLDRSTNAHIHTHKRKGVSAKAISSAVMSNVESIDADVAHVDADHNAGDGNSDDATARAVAVAVDDVLAGIASADATAQSLSNVSMGSNNSKSASDCVQPTSSGNGNSAANGSNRPKRPEKLMLDLNDRSKYSKEVSV